MKTSGTNPKIAIYRLAGLNRPLVRISTAQKIRTMVRARLAGMKYRPEIDGLRTVAVVPVILFHAGFELFSGGFAGVDIFFVISGYLITTILINEIESGDFSIARFYERRARRILPALFFVILCILPFAWMWLLPNQMKDFSQSIIAVGLFVSNILFWSEDGYFAAASENKPLLHTWSLAVEEQYYLIFPLFLLFAWRFGKDRVFWMIVVLSACSLALSEWGWRSAPSANFYLSPYRAWELFAGSIAAFVVSRHGVRRSNLLSLLGAGAILYALFFYDSETPFPSLYTLVPVVGVALIVMYGHRDTFVARALSTKPFVAIGLISYSAYLWHHPLFALARIRSLHEPSAILMLGLSVLSIALAAFSWKFIEQPFRKGSQSILSTRRAVFAWSLVCILVFGAFGVMGDANKGFPHRFDPEVTDILTAARHSAKQTCHYGPRNDLPDFPVENCLLPPTTMSKSVMLLGDSHSLALSEHLVEELARQGYGVYNASYAGCPPVLGLRRYDLSSESQCETFIQQAYDFADRADIDTLILTARFPLYVHGIRFDNQEGGVETGGAAHVDDATHAKTSLEDPQRPERVIAALSREISALSERFEIVLVAPVPEAGWSVPEQVAKQKLFAGHDEWTLSTSRAVYERRAAPVLNLFQSLADTNDNVRFAKIHDLLCSDVTGRCANARDGSILYMDDDHLSNPGAQVAVPEILKELNALSKQAVSNKAH